WRVGVRTELDMLPRKALPGQCFIGHEKFDLLTNGQKIAGAAQRRRRDGLLIQGSVQSPATGVESSAWHQQMCQTGAAQFGAEWTSLSLDAPLLRRALELTTQKYS